MKKHLLIVVALSMCLIVRAQNESPLSHIPPDALTVLHINLPSITGKVSWKEIISQMHHEMKDSSHEKMRALMEDPAASGIDNSHGVLIAISKAVPPDSIGFQTIIGHVSDPVKLRSSLERMYPGDRMMATSDQTMQLATNHFSISWNARLFALVLPIRKGFELKGMHGKPDGHRESVWVDKSILSKRSWEALAGNQVSTFTTDPYFKNALAFDVDIQILSSFPGIGDMLKNFPMMARSIPPNKTVSNEAGNNKMVCNIRFENGKIDVISRTAVNPHADSMWRQVKAKPANSNLLARLPSNAAGYFSLSVDPSIFVQLIDANKKTRARIDSVLAKRNLKLEDLVNMVKGDFLVFAGAPIKNDSTKKTEVPVCVVITFNKPESMMKLQGLMPGIAKDSVQGKKMAKLMQQVKVAFNLKDGIIVLSNNQQTANAFANSNPGNFTPDIADMQNNPVNIMLNLQSLGEVMQGMATMIPGAHGPMGNAQHTINKIYLSAGHYDNGVVDSHLIITTADASENSLRTLLKMAASRGSKQGGGN